MSHSPLTPEAAAAAKTKCQCGHPRGIHFLRRKTGAFTLCRYCTCQEFIEGPLKALPEVRARGWPEHSPRRADRSPQLALCHVRGA
jgi:ribosomal protein S14